ncbi:MAG: type II secretion system minor pseudopilin GspH [Gammaproteobacteria bacterium]|nr:type II secretion system minor pseudopilin GspH [Gammaproteobacteria bacterium]
MQLKKNIGFTLIEILIVMLILSIVGGITLLTISHNRNTQLATYSSQLVNRLTLAEQYAMLMPAVLGLKITDTSLEFFNYQEKTATFISSTEPTLGLYRIPKSIKLTLKRETENSDEDSKQPPIIFSSSGSLTPFSLLLGSTNEPPSYEIEASANGNIHIKKLNPNDDL